MASAGLRPPEGLFLRYPHELSGGQRQRVLIAGALALSPELLIADEPVSSLDASIRGEILALLLQLRDELGLGVLVVTHDLGLAWNIADRIAVMYLGRIVEAGPTEEVLQAPQHPYTQALLSVVPEIEQLQPVVLTGEIPDPTRIPTGCRFHPRCPALADRSAAAAGVDEACRSEPLAILPRRPARPPRRLPPRGAPVEHRPADREPRVSPLQAALPREMYVDRATWLRERDRVLFGEWFCVGRTERPGAPRAWAGRRGRRGRRVGAGHARRGRRAARGVQRLPAPRLPAVPGRARGRADLCEAGALRCPYHSWTYSLAGELLRSPHTDDVDPAGFSLHPVGVEEWAGFVFVHLTPDAADPIGEVLAAAATTWPATPWASWSRGGC